MPEGEETVVPLRVKAEADAISKLYFVGVEPQGETPAAAGQLPVSVGVVMTEDTTRPMLAQSIVRAPGYTLKIDHLILQRGWPR